MARTFLVVLLFLGATSSAKSTGAEELEGCKAATSPTNITAQNAFVAGYCMGIVEGSMWDLLTTELVCPPKGVTTGQSLKVLVKYMDEHPQELHERTAQLAARAFIKTWPCYR